MTELKQLIVCHIYNGMQTLSREEIINRLICAYDEDQRMALSTTGEHFLFDGATTEPEFRQITIAKLNKATDDQLVDLYNTFVLLSPGLQQVVKEKDKMTMD
jgi:hypothetical protein